MLGEHFNRVLISVEEELTDGDFEMDIIMKTATKTTKTVMFKLSYRDCYY